MRKWTQKIIGKIGLALAAAFFMLTATVPQASAAWAVVTHEKEYKFYTAKTPFRARINGINICEKKRYPRVARPGTCNVLGSGSSNCFAVNRIGTEWFLTTASDRKTVSAKMEEICSTHGKDACAKFKTYCVRPR